MSGSEPTLVTIELRFTTTESSAETAERIRESVAMIVGRQALEDFRVRAMPLTPRDPGNANESPRM